MNIRPEIITGVQTALSVALASLAFALVVQPAWYRWQRNRETDVADDLKRAAMNEKSLLSNAEGKLSDALINTMSLSRLEADFASCSIVAQLKHDGVVLCTNVREISDTFKPGVDGVIPISPTGV